MALLLCEVEDDNFSLMAKSIPRATTKRDWSPLFSNERVRILQNALMLLYRLTNRIHKNKSRQ